MLTLSRSDSKVLPEIEKPSASEQIPDDELGEEVSLAVNEYQDGTKTEESPYQISHDNQNVSRQDVNGNLDKVGLSVDHKALPSWFGHDLLRQS